VTMQDGQSNSDTPQDESNHESDGASAPVSEAQGAAQDTGGQTSNGAQGALNGQAFSQQLQEQIAQALKPVLADFRQQVTRNIEEQEEVKQMPESVAEGLERETRPTQSSDGESGDTQQSDAEQSAPEQSAQGQSAPSRAQSEEQDQSQAGAQDGQQAQEPEQEQGGIKGVVSGNLGPALDVGLRLVEHQAEQWLQSMITAGLDALLTETTRLAAQERASRGLHVGLEKAFSALPDSATTRDLRVQTEKTLQAILREAIDAVFAERARAALQEHGGLVSQEITHRNFTGALQHAQHGVQALLQEVIEVLRRQWQRVLRLLLRLVLTALQDSLAPGEKESLQDMSGESQEKSTSPPSSDSGQ